MARLTLHKRDSVKVDQLLVDAKGNPFGKTWYVNSSTGSNTANNGQDPTAPFLTIAYAVTKASAGDTIVILGSFSEAVTCNLAGVKFIGVGTGPVMTTWTAPTVAGSFCLSLTAANCLVENIKFRPVIYTTSGIPSGISLSNAGYTTIRNCRFQGQAGSYAAIYSASDTSDNVVIDGCEFVYMNTATNGYAIQAVETLSVAYSAWQIKNCTFDSCLYDIKLAGRNCLLEGNKHFINGLAANGTFGSAVTSKAVDLSGTNTGANVMTKCTLGGTYNLATYTPGTTGDVWMGNYCSIVATVAPNGLSVLIPAT